MWNYKGMHSDHGFFKPLDETKELGLILKPETPRSLLKNIP